MRLLCGSKVYLHVLVAGLRTFGATQTTGAAAIDKVNILELGLLFLSVTVIVGVVTPVVPTAGVPEITPPALSAKPFGSAGVTFQENGAVPETAVNWR